VADAGAGALRGVPEEEEIAGLQVVYMCPFCQVPTGIEVVGDLLADEAERVGLVEDDDGVQSFVFGHVAGSDAVKRQ
jgi:hypothetical protein